MAGGKKVPKCGACKNEVSDDDDALFCDGSCGKWFHMHCVNISIDDYKKIGDLKDIVLWMCAACKNEVRKGVKKTSSNVKSKRMEDNLCCECFSYIQILTEQISELTESYKLMSENVSFIQNSTTELKSEVRTLKCNSTFDSIWTDSTKRSFSEVIKSSSKPPLPVPEKKSSVKGNSSSSVGLEPRNLDLTSRHMAISDVSNSSDQESSRRSTVDGDGFQTVTNKRPRKMGLKSVADRPSDNQATKVSKLVMGKASNSKLSVVDRLSWVYVTRLDPSVTENDLIDHVTGLYSDIEVKCEKLATRHSSYNSFKVGLPKHLGDDCMKPDNWPKGLLIGKFVPQRRPRQLSNDSSKPVNDVVSEYSKNGEQ